MPGRNEFSDKTFNSNFRHVPYYRNGGGKHIYKFLLNLSNALGLTFQRFLSIFIEKKRFHYKLTIDNT